MCGHSRGHHRSVARAGRPQADDKRASDAEREAVVAELRAHAGEGRLTVGELEGRVTTALAARSRRELAALTTDLPSAPRAPRDARAEFGEHLRTYLAVMALLVVIWALTGADYFWPVWPALGWGIGVLSHASGVRRRPPARRLTA